jgi:hypothetical protein
MSMKPYPFLAEEDKAAYRVPVRYEEIRSHPILLRAHKDTSTTPPGTEMSLNL